MSITSRLTTIAAAGSGGAGYWANHIVSTSGTFSALNSIAVDSANNSVVITKLEDGTYDDFAIIKVGDDGSVVWNKRYELGTSAGQTATVGSTKAIAVDSSDNVYFTAQAAQPGSSYITDWLFTKLNSDGVYQWNKFMYSTVSNTYERGLGTFIDSFDNIYSFGNSYNNGVAVMKYDTAGNRSFSYDWTGSYFYQCLSLTTDASNNLVGCAAMDGFYGFPYAVFSMSNTGTLNWVRRFGLDSSGGSQNVFLFNAVVYAGDIYAVGATAYGVSGGTVYAGLLLKLNSSGVIQYQKYIGDNSGSGNSTFLYNIKMTSDNRMIISGRRTESSVAGVYVAEVTPSTGAIVWQQRVSNSGFNLQAADMKIAEDNLYLTGYSDVLKLPSDGSITGTFGNYTIANSSLNTTTSSISDGTISPTRATFSTGDNGATFSTANLGYTEAVETIS